MMNQSNPRTLSSEELSSLPGVELEEYYHDQAVYKLNKALVEAVEWMTFREIVEQVRGVMERGSEESNATS